jgi:hypothetical protein
LPAKFSRPVVGGGVSREQAGKVADRIGDRREGRAHWSRGFQGGTSRAAGSDGGGAEEQWRASVRGSWELTVSVWSSGQCQGVQRGTGAAVCIGKMMAA